MVAALILLPVFLTYLFLRSTINFPWSAGSTITFDQFVALGGWAQAIIAWFTLVVALIATTQITFIYKQHRIEKQRAEFEIYHQLTTSEMQSTKRFLNTSEVRAVLNDLRMAVIELNCCPEELSADERRYRFDQLLNDLRVKLDAIGISMTWPLLESTKMGLDYIELLINEYNYVATLVVDGVIDEQFTDGLIRNNFLTTYGLVEPIISLRRIRTPKFAGQFSKFCKS